MKKIQKNITFHILIFVVLVILLPVKSYAQEIMPMSTQAGRNIHINAEQTGYIYKIMNGRQYKRLWSYTYGKWLDSEWTPA